MRYSSTSVPRGRDAGPRAPQLPLGWTEVWSAVHGRPYYANRALGTTVWSVAETQNHAEAPTFASPYRHRALPPSPRDADGLELHSAAGSMENELQPRYDGGATTLVPTSSVRVSRHGSIAIAASPSIAASAPATAPAYASAHASTPTLPRATLPAGWTPHFSQQHGRMFYGSTALGKTVWSIEEARAADAAALVQRPARVPARLHVAQPQPTALVRSRAPATRTPSASSTGAAAAARTLAAENEVLTARLKAAVALRRDAADALKHQEQSAAKEKAALETQLKEAELKIKMAESRASYYATLRPTAVTAAAAAHPPRVPPRSPEGIAAHMIRRARNRAAALGFESWKCFVSRLGELRAAREKTKLRAELDAAQRTLAQFQRSQRVHAPLPTAGAVRSADAGGREHRLRLAAHAANRVMRRTLAMGWDQWVGYYNAVQALEDEHEELATIDSTADLESHLDGTRSARAVPRVNGVTRWIEQDDASAARIKRLEAEYKQKELQLEALHAERAEQERIERAREFERSLTMHMDADELKAHAIVVKAHKLQLDSRFAKKAAELEESHAAKDRARKEVHDALLADMKRNEQLRETAHESALKAAQDTQHAGSVRVQQHAEFFEERERKLTEMLMERKREVEKAHLQRDLELQEREAELGRQHRRLEARIRERDTRHAEKGDELDAAHDTRMMELERKHAVLEEEHRARTFAHHAEHAARTEELHEEHLKRVAAHIEEHAARTEHYDTHHAARSAALAEEHAERAAAVEEEHARREAELNARQAELHSEFHSKHAELELSHEKQVSEAFAKLDREHAIRLDRMQSEMEDRLAHMERVHEDHVEHIEAQLLNREEAVATHERLFAEEAAMHKRTMVDELAHAKLVLTDSYRDRMTELQVCTATTRVLPCLFSIAHNCAFG